MPRTPTKRRTRSRDRNSLPPFLLAAVAAHALVLQSVGFRLPDPSKSERPPSLEVTLAQYYSEQAPDQADFIGQANQQGSGEAEEANAPTTTEDSPFPDPSFKEMASTPEAPQTPPAPGTPELSTRSAQARKTAPNETAPETDAAPATRPAAGLLQHSLEIASLSAQLDSERKLWAKRPKSRALSAATVRSAADAAYLDQWRRRVENVGNLNYPNEARSNRIYGELVLAVTLYGNGTIKDVVVESSSGQRILDEAARRIVHLAGPYAPIPRELDADELTIVRTWRFEPGDRLAAQ